MEISTTTANPSPFKWIWFQTTKSGKRVAFGWSNRSHRAIRIAMADAEMWISTECAEKIPGHPFKVMAGEA